MGLVVGVNLWQHPLRLIARSGQRPWPRLGHSVRDSAETDLLARFPVHVATEWLGNSIPVAVAHYLRVRPEDFARAVAEPWPTSAKSGALGGAEGGAACTRIQKHGITNGEAPPLEACDVMRFLARRYAFLYNDLGAGNRT